MKKSYFAQITSYSMADSIDLKIIDKLKVNSRLSYVEIGKQIGLSPSSVRERVQRLEYTGVIKGYKVQIDNRKIGLTVEAFIMFKVFTGRLKSFSERIIQLPEIDEFHRITGSHNIIMKAVFKDQSHLERFIASIQSYGEPSTYLILSNMRINV